jgi:hypothetical protein
MHRLTGILKYQQMTAAARSTMRTERQWAIGFDVRPQRLHTIICMIRAWNVHVQSPNSGALRNDSPITATIFVRPSFELVKFRGRLINISGKIARTGAGDWRQAPAHQSQLLNFNGKIAWHFKKSSRQKFLIRNRNLC